LLFRFQNVHDFPQFWEFWSEISDLESPKDHKLTLKFKSSFKDPAKTVFAQKNRLNTKYFLLQLKYNNCSVFLGGHFRTLQKNADRPG